MPLHTVTQPFMSVSNAIKPLYVSKTVDLPDTAEYKKTETVIVGSS